jgi:phosphate butyryltransferase
MITNFDELIKLVKSKPTRRLGIASAEGEEIILAVKHAVEEHIIFPILIGDQEKIETICKKVNFDTRRCQIINEKDMDRAAFKAVSLVKDKAADMLMKGKVGTSTLLKAVLDKERGLRSGKLLSHVSVIQTRRYPKLMLVTDGGMNIKPDINKKVEIMLNAVEVAKKLGIDIPKAACLAAIETVNSDMPETVDAQALTEMAKRKEIKGVIVDGPMALDVALDSKSAEIKGIKSEVAGDTDIFLVPDIASGNIFVKGLIYLAEAKVGGIVVGGGAPIVLLSRSDSAETKLYSIALGAAIC